MGQIVKQIWGVILFKILHILIIMKIPLRKITALVLAMYDESGIITPSRFGMLIGINPYYVSKSLKHYATDEGLFKRWLEGSQRDGFEFQYQITKWGQARLVYLRTADPLIDRYCEMLEDFLIAGQTRFIPQLYKSARLVTKWYVWERKAGKTIKEEKIDENIWKALDMYPQLKERGLL